MPAPRRRPTSKLNTADFLLGENAEECQIHCPSRIMPERPGGRTRGERPLMPGGRRNLPSGLNVVVGVGLFELLAQTDVLIPQLLELAHRLLERLRLGLAPADRLQGEREAEQRPDEQDALRGEEEEQ